MADNASDRNASQTFLLAKLLNGIAEKLSVSLIDRMTEGLTEVAIQQESRDNVQRFSGNISTNDAVLSNVVNIQTSPADCIRIV